MSKLIIVTVGTSALFEHSGWQYGSNNVKWDKPDDLIEKLENEALNDETIEYDHQKEQATKNLVLNLKSYYQTGRGLDELPAEMASLIAFQKVEGYGKITNDDRIVLLHSDTQDGKLCAEINQDLMGLEINNNGVEAIAKVSWNVEIKKVKDLDATKPDPFSDAGLINFQSIVEKRIKEFKGHIFMNITGGYKAVIPFATLLCYMYSITLFYLFEKSQGIIKLETDYFEQRFGIPQHRNVQLADPNILGRRGVDTNGLQ